MKKSLLAVMMLACLSAAACGNSMADDARNRPAQEESAFGEAAGVGTDVTEPQGAVMDVPKTEDTPAGETEPEGMVTDVPKTENMAAGETEPEGMVTGVLKTEDTSAGETEPAGNVVTYDVDGVYMQVTLPKEWSYEILTPEMILTDGMESCMIRFWLTDDPDISFELAYWPMFGICGTGVTIESMELDNGRSATWYTESLEGKIWFSICMKKQEDSSAKGSYVINGGLEEELWNQYKDALTDIVKTIDVR